MKLINDPEERAKRYKWHKTVLDKHDSDGDGYIQEAEMEPFLKELWKHDFGEWARKYWRAMNAFDHTTQGISAEDFTTCHVFLDKIGFDDFYKPRDPNAAAAGSDFKYFHNYGGPDKPRGEGFDAKVQEIIGDIQGFWRMMGGDAQRGHLEHLRRVKSDQAYAQASTYDKVKGVWASKTKGGESGYLREHDVDSFRAFASELWNLPVDEAFGTKYLTALALYNTSRDGVSITDFVDCWIEFDFLAISGI